MITKLTEQQEKKIPEYIEKYINLASKPTNRIEATKAVEAIYKEMGFKKPIVIFGESPLSTAIMAAIVKTISKEDKLDSKSSQLDFQLHSQLHSQLDSQLDSQLHSQLKDINNNWYLSIWWISWLSLYDYAKYIGVKFDSKKYKIFTDFVSNVSFIIPYNGIAFVSETPIRISWDDKQLHHASKPAVEYKDGYGMYMYHGVRVTEEIIKTPELLTKKDWINENNLEVRRVIQEQMGERFVKEMDAKLIHEDLRGKLLEIELPNDPEKIARYVHVKDSSTDRDYYLRVPPTINRTAEGIAWTFNMDEKDYNPMAEA
ncbi:MAG: DUF6745 domain-containing protein [Candidatus Dormibacteria bacterium]